MTNVRKAVLVGMATGALLFGGASAASAAAAPPQSLAGALTGAVTTSVPLSNLPLVGGVAGG